MGKKKKGKLVYLFPGQNVGKSMGSNLWKLSKRAAETFFQIDTILKRNLSRTCFIGPEEDLWKVTNAQTCSMAVSLALLSALDELRETDSRLKSCFLEDPDLIAGHSSGYITALVFDDVLSQDDGIKLSKKRSSLMDRASKMNKGKMVPLIVSDARKMKELFEKMSLGGNYNSRTQIVPSGSIQLMNKAVKLPGIKRVLAPLKLQAACHSPCMSRVKQELADFLETLNFEKPRKPILGNSHAQLIATAAEAKQEILDQFDGWVNWYPSMEKAIEMGATTFVEMGWGMVLSDNLKRDFENIEVLSGLEEIEKALRYSRRKHIRQIFQQRPSPSLVPRSLS